MNGPAKSAYRPSTASPHLDEGRRSANDSIPRLKRRSVNVRFNIRPSWFCLLYIVSLTTDWGTWRGTGRWRGSCGPRTSRNNAVHNTESLLFACAMEVGHQPTTLESNDTDAVDQLELHYLRTTRQAKSAALFPVTDSVPSAEGTGSKEKKLTLNQIFYRAGKRGLGGGIPGALAGVMQVLSLMWLRTIINYQCRYGTNFFQALHTLLQEGGVPRLYRGVSFAIVQAPLSRFVSTAANDGIESLLASFSWTNSWGPGRTTVVASIVVGLWRMMLMRKSNWCLVVSTTGGYCIDFVALAPSSFSY